jgi:Zn-dependent protease with chaperone function
VLPGEVAEMPRRKKKALYMISVVSEMFNIHPQTLRTYEREGLIRPSRTEGNTRLYSQDDLERIELILRLTNKTTLLLGAMTGLLVIFGDYFGGTQGMVIAFLFALLMNFGSYWYSDKIVLKMYRAREVTEAEAPELVGMVRSLSQRAQLPMPRVYIVPNESPNAFATGRNPQHAAVAVTSGILRIMNYEQLEGASALERLHAATERIPLEANPATSQATSHLFIVNPLSGRSFLRFFSTHPPVEERVKRLRAMQV